jgi:hypothetical protein
VEAAEAAVGVAVPLLAQQGLREAAQLDKGIMVVQVIVLEVVVEAVALGNLVEQALQLLQGKAAMEF